MRVPRWTVPLILGAGALALPGVASAKGTHSCASVVIGSDQFSAIKAKGVTCTFVRTTFIPELDKAQEVQGWEQARPKHLTASSTRDTYTKGKKKIALTFTFTG